MTRVHGPCFDDLVRLFYAPRAGRICGAYAILALRIIIYLIYTLRINKFFFGYALHIHKVQRGYKLSVVRKVITMLNFVTTLSFSVTTPSYKPKYVHLHLIVQQPAGHAGVGEHW